LYVDVSIVSPALDADGVGGNGRISCAGAVVATTMPRMALHKDRMALDFMIIALIGA
jgi:hypothetical protein